MRSADTSVSLRAGMAAVVAALAVAGCGSGGNTGIPPRTDAAAPVATTPATTAPATSSAPPASQAPPQPSARKQPRPREQMPRRHRRARKPAAPAPARTPAPAQDPARSASPRRAPAPTPAPEPAGQPIDERASLVLASKESDVKYTQRGTATGTFDGAMELTAEITEKGVEVTFSVAVEGEQRGTIRGRGLVTPTLTGGRMAPVTGTARLTGGTGDFAGIRGKHLEVTGKAALDGSKATVRLTGTVFP